MPEESPFLRDELALVRTRLANERTLLAYVRTALAFGVVGGTLLKFFNTVPAQGTGVAFLAIGAATLGAGVYRYRAVHGRLKPLSREV